MPSDLIFSDIKRRVHILPTALAKILNFYYIKGEYITAKAQAGVALRLMNVFGFSTL